MRTKIEDTLKTFGIKSKVAYAFEGYSSVTYLLDVDDGVQIKKVHRYALDIAKSLNVSNVRIGTKLTVYSGKSYLPIEAGIKSDKILYFDPDKLVEQKIPMGIDNFGRTIIWDLDNPATPHILIGGATGSGKSVCIRSTIEYAILAGMDEIIILDPKHEFTEYDNGGNILVVNDIDSIELCVAIAVDEMNKRIREGFAKKTLILFDEFADAFANSRNWKQLGNDKSLEENMRLLLQKGRSTGFRILSATQRASTKIITGDAKVNYPVKMCFRVPSHTDSRVMLDENGAETLNGHGDFLISSPEYNGLVRGQGFYNKKAE